MQTLERCADVISGSTHMEDLHSVPDFPIFMGCVDHGREQDLVADLTWQISRETGLIQLKHLIPLAILYQAQHAGAVGGIWAEHHIRFAKFLEKRGPAAVFEIGGAHGILSKQYRKHADVPWTILEPNPAPVADCTAQFIKGFFDDTFVFEGAFDTVVHSHVFEHIYEPDRFMSHLAGFMTDGKRLIFSLPNMQEMLVRNYTNCINFEHTIFLTEPYVEYLLSRHGFRLLSKEYFLDDHSIFFDAVRDSSVLPLALPTGLYAENKQTYQNYVDYHQKLIVQLNRKIAASQEPVYLFGAHVFAQYLIINGLNTEKIVCVLDNDPHKQGHRLYGTDLTVQAPKVLRGLAAPLVILKAGIYNHEIKADILAHINEHAVFLE